MTHPFPGTFTVVDGIDGCGKGVIVDAIADALHDRGMRILNLSTFWKKFPRLPEWTDKIVGEREEIPISAFDVLLSEEPTYGWIGAAIRDEVIKKNNRTYSAHVTVELYAADRLLLYQRVLLPALEKGKHVVQSRSVLSSMVYQPLQDRLADEPPLRIEDVLRLEGNRFAFAHAPNLLIIPTLNDIDAALERLGNREKKDDCIFEKREFLGKIQSVYQSDYVRHLFESYGTNVQYLDTSTSVQETKEGALALYKEQFPQLFQD